MSALGSCKKTFELSYFCSILRHEEKEVFPTPSTIQKKDLLHQKLIQKENDLRQAQDKLRAADRQIKGISKPHDVN